METRSSLPSSQQPLSWATWVESTPSYAIHFISILISSSHLSLGLRSGLFSSDFLPKTICNFLLLCVPHVPSNSQSFIRWPIMLGETQLWSYSQCSLSSLLSPSTLSLSAPSFATHVTASNISDLLYMIVHLYGRGTGRWHSVGRRSTLELSENTLW